MSALYSALINGKLGFITTTCFTLFILNVIIFPNYKLATTTTTAAVNIELEQGTNVANLATLLHNILPQVVLNVYDPYKDHTVNLIAAGSLSGYYLTSLLCTLVDLFVSSRGTYSYS
jgi:hypothetical protein